MGVQDVIPMWLVALMLGRDTGLVTGLLWMRSRDPDSPPLIDSLRTGNFKSFEVKPTQLSKINTALQVSLMGTALTSMAWQVPPPSLVDPLWCVANPNLPLPPPNGDPSAFFVHCTMLTRFFVWPQIPAVTRWLPRPSLQVLTTT
jgi:phosphatidylglycerophosphate synthase